MSDDGLTPDLAASYLKKEAVNIYQKLARGGTLNKGERALLQSIADSDKEPTHWKTQDEIAAAYGVSRQLVAFEWPKKAPKGTFDKEADGYPIKKINAWVSSNLSRSVEADDGSIDEISRLKREELRLKCEKLQIDNDRKLGLYEESATVREDVVTMIATAKERLFRLPAELAPTVTTLDPPEAVAVIEAAIREALSSLSSADYARNKATIRLAIANGREFEEFLAKKALAENPPKKKATKKKAAKKATKKKAAVPKKAAKKATKKKAQVPKKAAKKGAKK